MKKRTIEDVYEELSDKKEKRAELDMEINELQQELEAKSARKKRYWENKEEENLRSKIWRLQQKLDKIVENKKNILGGKENESRN